MTQGKHNALDIMLLKHEYEELTQMRLHGYDYLTAHEIANGEYNWWAVLQRERGGANEQ